MSEAYGHLRSCTYTREEVEAFLNDIGEKVLESHGSYLHSVLALNRLLESSNAAEVFDDSLKEQARDLWVKIKASGFQLNNPPLLFGAPELEEDSA